MAKVEQGNVPHQQELPKGEVVFSKQLTLRELLNLSPEESSQKNLLDTVPFNFEVRDLRDSFLHIVSFSEAQPVHLWNLFPLLKAAKPGGISRRGQDTDAISADWRIILPEVREKELVPRRLYSFHKKYVPEFSEFEENHFELFWKVLETGAKGEKELSFLSQQLDQFIDEREFFAKYGRQHDFPNNPEEKYRVLLFSKSFKPFLIEKGLCIPPNPDPKDSDPFSQTLKLFHSVGAQEQRALVTEFYKKSVDEGGIDVEREFGCYLRFSEGCPLIAILIGKDGELNKIVEGRLWPLDVVEKEVPARDPSFAPQRGGFKRLENGHIELTKGESFARISFVKTEDGYKKAKIEDIHLSTAETMVPLIVWQTDKDKQTGKRFYYCGKFDQLPKHDTLLGQLVVAAYSPEVRDQMAREIKMKGTNGKEVTQPMLEASSVLLVPRHSKLFLTQSPVILGLEDLALKK